MIYCVEDDESIRELEVYTLKSAGYEACGFSDGAALFAAMDRQPPQLVILDVMLPGGDGISLLKKMRASSRTREIPVIMATAKGSEYDKVLGLDSGADDYLVKPFGMMELLSRVKAVLRRASPPSPAVMTMGGITLDDERHVLTVDGQEVVVTYKEYELLRCLMAHPGMAFTRDRLLEQIWGYSYSGETRTVDVHIRTLRQKLGKWGDLVETVRGVGYRMGGES